jgi:N-methylhydantoinase A
VPRRDVLEVRERLRSDGSVFEPLHEEDFQPIIDKIRAENIPSVAVCFIHAYVNPAHELRAREILQAALGSDFSVTLSHEIAREWREYERASSAVMNAYIAPVVQRYLTRLEQELKDFGVDTPVHVMQSSGGIIRAKTAREQPVHTLLSGPVGGTIGGVALAKTTGRPQPAVRRYGRHILRHEPDHRRTPRRLQRNRAGRLAAAAAAGRNPHHRRGRRLAGVAGSGCAPRRSTVGGR